MNSLCGYRMASTSTTSDSEALHSCIYMCWRVWGAFVLSNINVMTIQIERLYGYIVYSAFTVDHILVVL